MEEAIKKHDPYSALRFKEFRYFFAARLLLTLAFQVQVIVINWMAYEHTRDPWTLGIMGLIEALPIIMVSLFGGHYADKFNRRKIILICVFVLIAGSAFLTWFSYNGALNLQQFGVMPVFAVVLLIGIARGFLGPAVPAFSAQLIPKEFYTNAAAWNSTVWQLGSVAGPAIGGICYAKLGASITSFIALILMLATVVFYMLISNKPIPEKSKEETLFESLSSGIKYVFKNQVIISAITLDLFAVLFGGAVAMLPVFADQVLHVGPDGLGYLRAAPALGAVIMAVVLAYYPPVRNSGKKLLWNVALFGLCMIAFALSKNFILSFVILLLSGMFDSVSVVIRHTIIQLFTPDEMRGRVSSVNNIFIGASNEIGAFESGLAAKVMGLIPSVIMGGVVTLLVVAASLKFAPNLKNLHLQKHT
ncbi:MAG TPA: MFS transporter [Bacteroidia bacterium]|nr:MFS transporter [Bacteroidia bacterium]